MRTVTEKLFNFFSSSRILKIIIIFTLFLNIGCSGLTGSIPSGLFDNNAQVTNFRYTFHGCTGVSCAVPTLWISHPGVTIHGSCFQNVTNASNYASMPADWK